MATPDEARSLQSGTARSHRPRRLRGALRYASWRRPLPRWLGHAMFSMWMTIFAFVWLFLIPMFLVMIVGPDCWLRFAWFQPWWDGTVCAGYAWVAATVAFLGVMIIRPPERTARR